MVCLLTINRDIHMLAPDARCLDYSLIICSPFMSWQSGNHISFQVQLETFGYSAVHLF